MLVKTFGSSVCGVDAKIITLEVNLRGDQHYSIEGLPDDNVKENFQCIESAIKFNKYFMPRIKLEVNIAPAEIINVDSALDLPIAIGVLGASEQIQDISVLSQYILMGELSLDGSVQPIKGALSIAIQARKEGYKGFILPKQNAREAAIVNQLEVYGVKHIKEVVDFLEGKIKLIPEEVDAREDFYESQYNFEIDFSDIKGQENIKRALEIAAAGGHNTLLIGAPDTGKAMLVKRVPTVLPPLTLHEALETTKIYSVLGKLPENSALVSHRPFRSPYASSSDVALAGGGGISKPEEISLAHNGILFLDELPEFTHTAIETVRQSMEDQSIIISGAKLTLKFPTNFMLIASMNPCPCGYYNHPDKACTCLPGTVQKYLNRISDTLLDRIDLQIEIMPLSISELNNNAEGEPSTKIRERVIKARAIQTERYKALMGIYVNAQMTTQLLHQYCVISQAGQALLKRAMERQSLNARAYDHILKISRTIADLEGTENIQPQHLAEAIQYRSLDREGWPPDDI